MSTYFWTFAIVPVQEYISEARRSRDLRAGSSILSYLVLRILRYLQLQKAKVIIPHESLSPYLQKSDVAIDFRDFLHETHYSIPNRATGSLACEERRAREIFYGSGEAKGNDSSKLAGLQGQLEQAWQDILESLDTGENMLGGTGKSDYRKEAYNLIKSYIPKFNTLHCPMQVIWAVLPIEPNTGTRNAADQKLPENIGKVEELFQRVKMSRLAPQWDVGGPVGKCTLCSKREAMGPKQGWAEHWGFWKKWVELRWVTLGARTDPRERLCWFCFARRLLGYLQPADRAATGFPSTSEIAARSWYNESAQRKNIVDEIFKKLKGILSDAPEEVDFWPFVFKKGFSPHRIEDLKLPKDKEQDLLALSKDYRDELQRISKDDPRHKAPIWPTNYLSVLVFDGDNMGNAVKSQPLVIPEEIASFATGLVDTLVEHQAQAFYLGGDEGLLLAPIDTCLSLAQALCASFRHSVSNAHTISVGIAIFDRERPLGLAIEAAHQAVANAKRLPGKGAVMISVQTASGNTWGVRAHWGAVWDWLSRGVEWIHEGKLSRGWPYELQRLFESLHHELIKSPEDFQVMVDEMMRISGRNLGPYCSGEDRKMQIPGFLSEVRDAFLNIGFYPRPRRGMEDSDENVDFVQLFHLMAFLAREGVPRS